MKNCQRKMNYFANVLENVDIALFISISCQKIIVSNETFSCNAEQIGGGGGGIVSQGIGRENETLKK